MKKNKAYSKDITKQFHLEWLENELMSLKPRTKLFNLLKSHLTQYGYWKNKPRGDAKKGYYSMISANNSTSIYQ